ncbi:hypothetical protein Q7P37_009661 [Cladosporium fusiforme]
MHLTNTLTWALALAASLPTVAGEYKYNEKLKVRMLGEIPGMVKRPKRPAEWMGRCGGNDVKEGGWACGNFGSTGTVIYKCQGGWLKRKEVCTWANGTGGQCVKNQRRKGHKYYPLVDGSKVVCVQPTDL